MEKQLEISDQQFDQFTTFVKANYGINLGKDKKTMIVGRLHGVLEQKGISNFSDYLNQIFADKEGESLRTLLDKITTNHTFFMREVEHFDFFSRNVLPWISSVAKDRDYRIWSAGCSSGEEPYTLAMLIWEYLGRNKFLCNTSILATDISTQVLTKASRGIYPFEHISVLPEKWRKEYFKFYDNENSEVVDKLKNDVIFRKFNLMEESFPFKKKFHTIFCRNVMIYFDLETKLKLIRKFYDHTEPGGYLFIGQSETIPREMTDYKYVMPSVYRKMEG